MAKQIRFQVRRVGGEWVIRREDALWNAWLEEPLKELAIARAYELEEGFKPSVVVIHHEDGLPAEREFPEAEIVSPLRSLEETLYDSHDAGRGATARWVF